MKKACFAAGCFWGVEHKFSQLKGIIKTKVGYTGGHLKDPSYEDVCAGNTGHAEAILIEYDESQVTFEMLLDFFWKIHDPTTLNQQGPDIGHQYRSAIFYMDDHQKQTAEAIKKKLNHSGDFKSLIVTEITEALPFYPAEEYHQQYIAKRHMA